MSRVRVGAALGMLVLWLAAVSAASAQAPRVITPRPDHWGLFSNYNVHIGIETVSGDDPRFQFDLDTGGDLDLWDYVHGRVNAAFNYEAILGEQYQPFDPNQGNYSIEISSSARLGATEVTGVYHHTSRHLGDRPKVFGIAWNLLGVQVAHAREGVSSDWQVRARAAKATAIFFVDYDAELTADARYRRRLWSHVAVVGRASGIIRTIDRQVSGRPTQRGGRIEGAVRFTGRGAGVEFYTGVEQRIEADAIEARPVRWMFLGFRVESLDRGR